MRTVAYKLTLQPLTLYWCLSPCLVRKKKLAASIIIHKMLHVDLAY